jgi:predicted PolB exonuclease-like 3'-5' exonuclease
MIKIPLTKILFLDIETVGIEKDYDSCLEKRPEIANQFDKYFDWFQKRFPEDALVEIDQKNFMFKRRAALVPEFAKIVCVNVQFVMDNGEIKSQSFSGDDEKVLLRDCKKVLDKCYRLDFHICGHNLKNFDIPMLAKRMIINGIAPSSMLPSYDTKPWEVKAIDTKDVWQYGAYSSIGSLDLLCASLGVPSPKEGDVTGDKVHTAYWDEGRLKEITEYCERDVRVLIDIIIKLKELEQ